ncbi:MAG: TonB-dependent receptor [Verrucomicrobiota bacterium]
MKRYPRLVFALLCLSGALAPTAVTSASAQTTSNASAGIIVGRVLNGSTGAYLENVRVRISGTNLEAITDQEGAYRLTGIPAGEVQVTASYIGLTAATRAVTIVPGQLGHFDFELTLPARGKPALPGAVVTLDQVTVVAAREFSAQALALNEQRQAANIKSVVAADEYNGAAAGQLGDFLKFIPGVSAIYSGNLATDISVRGFPGFTTGVSINGGTVAAASVGESRNVQIYAVPLNNVSRIEVSKVPTPDMPAAGLGGSVNIINRDGFQHKAPRFNYSLSSSFNGSRAFNLEKLPGPTERIQARNINPDLDLSYLRPINDSLAVTMAFSRIYPRTRSDATSANYDLNTLVQISNGWIPDSQFSLQTSGQLGVDWKFGRNNTLNASVQQTRRDGYWATSTFGATFGAGATGGPSFTQGAATAVGSVSQTFDYRYRIQNSVSSLVRFAHKGDVWRIDASLGLSTGKTHEGSADKGFFENSSGAISNLVIRGDGIGTASRKEKLLPTKYTVADRTGASLDILDGNGYSITNATVFDRNWEDQRLSGRADLTRAFATLLPLSLKAGVAVNRQDWSRNQSDQTYAFLPGSAVTERLASKWGLVDEAFSAALKPYPGNKIVHWISPRKTYELYQSRPELFVIDRATEYTTQANNDKRIVESITAGYLRGDLRAFSNRLLVVAGVRFEETSDEGWGPLQDPTAQYQKDAKGNLVRNAAGSPLLLTTDALARAKLRYERRGAHIAKSYGDLYPSVNASYSLLQDLVLRAAYAQTIGRPELNNILPGITITDVTATPGNRLITVVNTGLKPWTSNNYDLSLESYSIKGAIASVGVFKKDIKNFFGSTRYRATPELLTSLDLPVEAEYLDYDVVTTTNVGEAKITGCEFGYKQALTFLPQWASGMQVFINHTKMTLGGENASDFSGFNPKNTSWGVQLTRPRYVVKLNCSIMGETRRTPVAASVASGIPAGTYLWQGEYRRYTLSGEYRFSRRFGFYGSVGDFDTKGFNPVQRRYATADTPDYARYQRIQEWGITVTAGIKGEF